MKSYLVAYDIFDNKRRYRVAKVVDAYKIEGQKSSWETPLDRKSMRSMIEELEKIVLDEDRVNNLSSMEYHIPNFMRFFIGNGRFLQD